MKKKYGVIATAAALMCGSMCALGGCDLSNPTEAEKLAYVSVDINPAIELIVDKEGNVVSARGENEDGQVLLYNEIELEGKQIDDAIDKITELAVKYGYLDENNTVVDTLVSAGDDGFASEILAKVNASVTATAASSGLTVTTDGDGAYSLLRKMNDFKAAFPDNAAVQNLTVQKFKLALSVSETGEISLDAAVALDDARLVNMLKETNGKLEKYATDAYTAAKTKAAAAYEKTTELAVQRVYAEFYMQRAIKNPMTAYYGGVYQMYASAAVGFSTVCDVAELAARVAKQPLDEAQIETVVKALGMESADALKNSDGEITVESIEAYADKLFKNTPASEALEKAKAELTKALSQAETDIKVKVNELSEEHRAQIEETAASARSLVDSMGNMFDFLPEIVKTIVNESVADMKEILREFDAVVADGKIEVSEVRDIADKFDAKAREYLDKIQADLTDDERAELKSKIDAELEKLAGKKAELEKAIDDAAKAAKDRLAELKAQRTKQQ